ncbi:MAG: PD-(D/E)XK nuclease family protein [Clostridiales bacterium]|nr:PD-(D/E)XK nuclease family protein [Clostridiales bacterium]
MITVRYYQGTDCITPYIIGYEVSRLSDEDSVYFVSPEYAKAQVEKMVLESLASRFPDPVTVHGGSADMTLSSAFTSGDVTSFIRLANDVLGTCGRLNIAPGGDVELRNAICSVLTGYKDDLKKLAGFAGRYEYINGLINIIGDFVRYGIGPKQLMEAVESCGSDNEDYKAKISDIAFIMEKIELMNDTYDLSLMTDPIKNAADVLAEFKEDGSKLELRRFRHIKDLASSRFVFIGFGSSRLLTPHESAFIRVLSEMGADIIFYTIGAPEDRSAPGIYSVGNDFLDIMVSGFGAVKEPFIPDQDETDPVLKSCIEAFVAGDSRKLPDRDSLMDKIILSQISDADDRIGYVMNEIIDLTRNKGYRYKDIRIVCCDDDLMSSITSVAEVFGLDLFIDKRVELIDTVIPMFAETILLLPLTGYSLPVVLRAMYSGMLKIPPYLADAFDNYCHLKAITDGRRMFSEIFYKRPEEAEGEEGKGRIRDNEPKVYIYENTVARDGEVLPEGFYPAGEIFWDHIVCDRLLPLKKTADAIFAADTLSSKAGLLMEYLDSNRVYIEALRDEYQEQKMDTQAQALVRGYDEMMKLLASFTHEMNDIPVTQASMISLVRTDMKNKTEGTIPLRIDSVEITKPKRAYISPCKVLFIIGADRSNFPSGRITDGIISSEELKTLQGSLKDIRLPDKAESSLKEQFVSSCLMMGTATDKIYMVHEFGQSMSRVYDFFRDKIETKDYKIAANQFRLLSCDDPVDGRYTFVSTYISSADMAVFAGKKMRCSVSALEQFNNCHFQYMAERVLRAKEREDNTEVRANAIGTVIHAMFENGIKDTGIKTTADLNRYCEQFIKDGVFDEAELDRITESTFKEAVNPKDVPSAYDSEGKDDALFVQREGRKIKRIFRWMYPEVIKECQQSGYVPSGFEAELGEGDYSFSIKTSSGMTFIFSGFIDRYDIRENDDGSGSVRVVDYKTGKKSISMPALVEGTQIQLPVYSHMLMNGLVKNGDYRLSNYGYLPVNMGAAKNQELKFSPKMLVNEVKPGDKDKMLSDNIGLISEYAMTTVVNSCDEIARGRADANVSPKGKCEYCRYKGLCGNDASNPRTREGSPILPEHFGAGSKDSVNQLIGNIREYLDKNDEGQEE